MKNSLPTLRELQDAAVTLLGQGDPAVVRESLLRVEVGTASARWPKASARLPSRTISIAS
ncbi:MAG: hypothetical protein WDN00_17635 [Limisphaerales bacterium]